MKITNCYFLPKTREFIEKYKGVDIHYTTHNGYEVSGYWYTFHALDDARKIIDYRLNKDMTVSNSRGLIFA